MSRYFNNKEVELLAPAGNFEIFKELLHSPADAFYLGGKSLNMRMHRKNFNFTDEELEEAISLAHKFGKKVYITLNNLLTCDEIETAKSFLIYLNTIKPDALIVQDLSLIPLIKELGVDLELHSSVMMNVHNLETIKRLRALGITRVVTSREMSLKTIKEFSSKTDMEFEYFTHGDMCIAHGSQCLYSTLLFGQSSNRGRCMKPCRWSFDIQKDGIRYNTKFPLAVKDLSLYEHLPEMIDSNVTSFKIEGRMRAAEYVSHLIENYGNALDRYIEDPEHFDRQKDSRKLQDRRLRDLSTAFAFGNQGLENINSRYEGTGKFYSTGKVFSKPRFVPESNDERIEKIKSSLPQHENSLAELSVHVVSKSQALVALNNGIKYIYLSGDVFEPFSKFSTDDIQEIINKKSNSKIYLCTPKMMDDTDFRELDNVLDSINGLDGLVVSNLGAISYFRNRELELIGDTSLNFYNNNAIDFYKSEGISLAALSLETKLDNLVNIVSDSKIPLEILVHGLPSVMYLDHDLYENLNANFETKEGHNKYFPENTMVLIDSLEQEHPVMRDYRGKNHILPSKEINLLKLIPSLKKSGINRFRIEGALYSDETLENIINIYRYALENNETDANCPLNSMGFTLGALNYD
ncbi:MAG: U32 family peptidase [Tissierellales bacterium]|jgi:putative protease|nr:U32 family peptidase [Tissierellales bacterium]